MIENNDNLYPHSILYHLKIEDSLDNNTYSISDKFEVNVDGNKKKKKKDDSLIFIICFSVALFYGALTFYCLRKE